MASSGNVPDVNRPQKRGRPRRAVFVETQEPETPENIGNVAPPRAPRRRIPPVQNVPPTPPRASRNQAPPVRNEPPQAPVAEQLFTLLQQVLTHGQQQQQNPGQGQGQEAEDQQLTRFLRFNPPKFNGEPDDRRAEFWLAEIEKIFRVLQYPDEQKVRYATFMLERAASQWWRVVERRWEREEVEITWEGFRTEFLRKYIPQSVKDKREKEFMNLIQGSLTVARYEAEYNRLVQYAPHILDDEERRRKRFVEGLRPELRRSLAIGRPATYDEAVEMALELEEEFQELRKIEDKRKEKGSGMERDRSNTLGKRPRTSTSGANKGKAPALPRRVNCSYCGGSNHTEAQCWRKQGKCLICGSADHTIRDCPRNSQKGTVGPRNQPQSSSAGRPPMRARAYAIIGDEKVDPSKVVEGMVLIQQFLCKALFDPGATHSFISSEDSPGAPP